MRRVSIVLPVHNQADHLERVVEELESRLAQLPIEHETVLVVNGSRDASAEVARELAARHPAAVRALELERGGWGRAVRHGLAAADGDLLCYTNSARTHPNDLFLAILYATCTPDCVIKANRRVREHLHRRVGSLLYNLECRALFDLCCWDINGTPKVFPRRFDRLLELRSDDDLLDLEFCRTCQREGYPLLELPLFSARRHGARSTTGLRSAARLYVGALRHALRDGRE